MKAIETVLHLRRSHGAKMKNMVPDYIWQIVKRYGLTPAEGERRSDETRSTDMNP